MNNTCFTFLLWKKKISSAFVVRVVGALRLVSTISIVFFFIMLQLPFVRRSHPNNVLVRVKPQKYSFRQEDTEKPQIPK